MISGGSKGLGAALVAYFLSRGHKVATFSRSVTEEVETWRAEYPDHFFYDSLSLTDKGAVKGFVDQVQGLFGDTEILVNNAGIARSGLLPLFHDKERACPTLPRKIIHRAPTRQRSKAVTCPLVNRSRFKNAA